MWCPRVVITHVDDLGMEQHVLFIHYFSYYFLVCKTRSFGVFFFLLNCVFQWSCVYFSRLWCYVGVLYPFVMLKIVRHELYMYNIIFLLEIGQLEVYVIINKLDINGFTIMFVSHSCQFYTILFDIIWFCQKHRSGWFNKVMCTSSLQCFHNCITTIIPKKMIFRYIGSPPFFNLFYI